MVKPMSTYISMMNLEIGLLVLLPIGLDASIVNKTVIITIINMNPMAPLLALQASYYVRKCAKESRCRMCKYYKNDYDKCKGNHKPYEYRDYCPEL